MIKHIKRLLGIGQEPTTTAPYKVEAPAETTPFPAPKKEKVSKPKVQKTPAVKAKTARKPRAPKA
jgi:hypothetical protein